MKRLIFPNPWGYPGPSEEVVHALQSRHGFSSSILDFLNSQNGFDERLFNRSMKLDPSGCKQSLGAFERSDLFEGDGIRELPKIDAGGTYNCQRLLDHIGYIAPYYFPIGTDFSGNLYVEVLHGRQKGWIGSLDHIALSCRTIDELAELLVGEDFHSMTLGEQADAFNENRDFFLFIATSFDSLLLDIHVDPAGEEVMQVRRCADRRRRTTAPTEPGADASTEEWRRLAQDDPDAQYRLSRRYQLGEGVPRDEAEAHSWLSKAARQGHAPAQFDMGLLHRYAHSKVVAQDLLAARRWFEQAATQGHAEAQDALGELFREGLGGPRDDAMARHWFGLSAAQGHPHAMVNLGFMAADEHEKLDWWIKAAELDSEAAQEALWERHNALHRHADHRLRQGDAAQAVRVWELLASQLDSDAARRLEMFYTDGEAASPDEKLANHWATRAWSLDLAEETHAKNRARAELDLRERAERGDAHAQFAMGNRHSWGRSGFSRALGMPGVEQDDALAAHWYEKAANQGHMHAQLSLGLLHDDGSGVPQDHAQARRWFECAAAQGSAEAQFCLGLMYQNAEGVAQDLAMAAQWFDKAAAQGHAKSQVNLSIMYSLGRGVEQDMDKARHWTELAAASGNERAQFTLGLWHDLGQGVPQDHVLARHWYEKAAANDDIHAPANLGRLHELGLGGPQDHAQAHACYTRSAVRDNAGGQFCLGRLYLYGLGVEQDLSLAREWLVKAAANGSAEAQALLTQWDEGSGAVC